MCATYYMAKRKQYRKRKSSKASYKPFKKGKKSYKKHARKSNLKGITRKLGTHTWGCSHVYGKKHVPKAIKPLLKMEEVFVNGYNTSGVITVTSGIQNMIYNLWQVGTALDLKTYTNINSAVTRRTFVKTMSMELNITNQETGQVYIELYDYVSRRDNPQTSASSITNATFVGLTPFDDTAFCQYFKVLKVTTYRLSAGETIEHILTVHPNKMMDYYRLNEGNLNMLGGVTHGVAYRTFGQAANDSAIGQYSVCPVKLVWVQVSKLRTYDVHTATSNATVTNNLVAFTNNPHIVLTDTDTVANETAA